MADPATLLVFGAIGALSSIVSAVTAWLTRRRSTEVSVKVGGHTLHVSSANRAEIEDAVRNLQEALKSESAKRATE